MKEWAWICAIPIFMFGQFCIIVHTIFAGIALFVTHIIQKWSEGKKLQAVTFYTLLSLAIAMLWTGANKIAADCSEFLGTPHNSIRGITFLSALLALSFIGIVAYYLREAQDEKE